MDLQDFFHQQYVSQGCVLDIAAFHCVGFFGNILEIEFGEGRGAVLRFPFGATKMIEPTQKGFCCQIIWGNDPI